MKSKGFLRSLVILIILVLTIGCDQLSKSIVRHKMDDNLQITFLNRHIILEKVENKGAFLSFGDSLSGPARVVLLNLLPLLAVGFGLIFLFTRELNRLTLISVILIVGGGIGNIYDRIAHGSVTDFIYMNFVVFQTGVFNVADVSITTGVIILLILNLVKRNDTPEVTADTADLEQ